MDGRDFSPRGIADKIFAASASEAAAFGDMATGEATGERKLPLGEMARRIASEKIAAAISPVVVTGVMRLFDILALLIVGGVIFGLYVFPRAQTIPSIYLAGLVAIPLVTVLLFQALDLYNIQSLRTYVRQSARLIAAWTSVFAITLALLFFSKVGGEVSRVWIGSWFSAGMVVLLLARVVVAALVRKWTRGGRLERRAVVVGGGTAGESLIRALQSSPDTDIRICGVFDDRGDDRSPPVVAGYPKLGNVAQLVEFARLTRIDLLIVSLPISAETRVLQLLKKLWVLPVDIRLSAHTNKLRFRPRSYSYIGNVPFLDVFDRPIADWDYVVKALFDRVVGALILLAFAPVMVVVALAVRLDSKGPALFKQKRFGFNNELIEVYKFRSMYVDQSDAAASKLVTKGDPRVTRVGRFIRKTSLDELPQLFNVVFKGDLSLVGPRPHALQAKAANILYDQVVDGYFARHRVKPGITGWAQVNGWRGETDTQEKLQRRVEHDLYYIENWSVMFDLHILAITPLSLITKSESAF